ncbi:MAG TPA: ABC transporter substrate-binding protein [Azospirillaceae bacterium]|nr:ABC transporter substrate-binding protein [Azospirillaceae bacterium]
MAGTITRRRLLGTGAALGLLPLAGARAAAPLRLGVLPFGTVQWEVEVIRRRGLDAQAGLELRTVELASPQAAQVALQGGAVDVIASDWLWVARQRASGAGLSFVPYSNAVGAVVVPAGSPIRGVPDLAGRRIGIAGGPVDKGWLLLKAYAEKAHGLDLEKTAKPVYAAPPLLSQQVESGGVDAALTYWHFAARLEARGMRQLVGIADLTRHLGLETAVPTLGYVFRDDWAEAEPQALAAFVRASRAAKEVLRTDDAVWRDIRPLLGAADDATAARLRDRFREGIVTRWGEAERVDAAELFALLARLGGEELVGAAREIPGGTFWPVSWG